jgi:hypothetical protein
MDRLGSAAFGGSIVSRNAHFFSHLHIARLGAVKDNITIDLENKTMSLSTTFSVGAPFVSNDVVPYDQGDGSRVIIPVRWGADMCLSVTYSKNPQVRNGVSLEGTNMRQGSGLLVRNFRAKLFRVNGLDSVHTVVLPKNMKRLTSQRGISGHKEFTVTGGAPRSGKRRCRA